MGRLRSIEDRLASGRSLPSSHGNIHERWFDQIAARPAVSKDMKKLEDVVGEFDEESWSASFGAEQYKRR